MKKIFASVCFSMVAFLGHAQVPGTLSYQGILLDKNGQPDTLAHQVSFFFYDAEKGGTLKGDRGPFDVKSKNGLFTLILGDGKGINNASIPSSFGDSQIWMKVQVDDDTLSSRTRFTSVPYAYKAENANKAALASGIESGKVVQSLNGIKDAVTITGSSGVTVNNTGNNIDIAGPSSIVNSLNSKTGNVTISAGSNITLTPSGNDLQISAPASLVNKVNNISGDITIASGTNVSVNNAGNTITISATGSGGISGTGSPGYVTFWNGTSSVSSNSNIFWDNTNSRLGLGTGSPTVRLDVNGTANATAFTGGGAGLTSLDAGNISSGTIADGRLEPTVDITVGLNVGSSKFTVDGNGNITKLNNITTSFPAVQGSANSFLSNNGSGTLTWATSLAGSQVGSGISASNITSGTLSASLIGSGINASNITTGTLAGSLLGAGSVTDAKLATGIDAGKLINVLPATVLGTGGANQIAFWNATPNALTTNSNLYWNNASSRLGIGTNSPANTLDVEGGVAIGAGYSGTTGAPANGAIIEGNVGIGTSSPAYMVDIIGTGTTFAFSRSLNVTNNYTGANNTYVLRGNTTGAGNIAYGIYMENEDFDYLSGRLGIGVTNPSSTRLAISTDAPTDQFGIQLTNNYNGGSYKYGVYNTITSDGLGERTAFYNQVSGNAGASQSIYGLRNSITPNGSSASYGTYNEILTGGTGPRYGTYNSVVGSSTNEVYGELSTANNNGTGNVSGIGAWVSKPGAVGGTAYGVNVTAQHSGTGDSYVYYGNSLSTTSGNRFGVYVTGETKNYFSGDVGIGKTNPTAKLDVNGTVNATSFTGSLSASYLTGSNNLPNSVLSTNLQDLAADGFLSAASLSGSNNLPVGVLPSTVPLGSGASGRVAVWTGASSVSSNANLSWDNANSRLGIGISAPTTSLYVRHTNGISSQGISLENTATGNPWSLYIANNDEFWLVQGGAEKGEFNPVSGAYTAVSDRRQKKDITDMENVLDKIFLLRPQTYRFKSQNGNAVKSIGFIAQDVNEVFPSLVNYSSENDLYTLDYSGFGVIAVKAIQEQQEMIKALKEEIDELKKELKKIGLAGGK